MPLNLIMLGPPGAGKGTQAQRVAVSRGIPRISTGDILREAVEAGSELGRRAKAIMDRGELVNDDVMIGIVRNRLDGTGAKPGFVLDGFPRTVAQAAALDAIMRGRDPLVVIDIEVPENELVRRLASRLICQNCGTIAPPSEPPAAACLRCGGPLVHRSDDTGNVVRERLSVYRQQSEPLRAYYRARPTFRSVNGAQPPDRVFAELTAAIDSIGAVVDSIGAGAADAGTVDAPGRRL